MSTRPSRATRASTTPASTPRATRSRASEPDRIASLPTEAMANDADRIYRLHLADPSAHLFEIELTITRPDPRGQELALPVWIPGSYMIREFARHIEAIGATCRGRAVALTQLDKHRWRAAPCRSTLTVRYRVYAFDLSVRGAYFDANRAFFNGTSVFLQVVGQTHLPCQVDLRAPRGPGSAAMKNWRVATTLARSGARPWGFGLYRAPDYDDLIDHPVEIGTFALAGFEAAGTQHWIAVSGRQDADLDRLARDLAPICEAQIRLFEPRRRKPPFDRYLFLVAAVGDGYGGLEHRSSTALICNRSDLPSANLEAVDDGYRRFLGLASHEYFHSWNVKRIKPAAFLPYALDRENYTRLLWIFEGFTSYYDDLMLVRAGAIDAAAYLKLLAATCSNVQRAPGRRNQSVAASSFDAWTKYYRQDEQSPNSVVSYYAKGSLVALCLDLSLRQQSRGRCSLDDVMRALWRRFGDQSAGLGEDEFPAILREATGIDLTDEIRQWAHGTSELPLAELLRPMGIELGWQAADPTPSLDTRMRAGPRGESVIATAYRGGAAQQAGLSAGDVLVAMDGLKVDAASLKGLLGRHRAGDRIRIHAFRRDELFDCELVLRPAPADDARLQWIDKPGARALALRSAWLSVSAAPRAARARARAAGSRRPTGPGAAGERA